MVKFPSKSETAPWFLSSTRIFTPDKGSPSSESVTKPEMFCACNPAQTTIKAIKKFKNDLMKAWTLMGGEKFLRSRDELKNIKFQRSIYVIKDIKRGEKFTTNNVRRIRPGFGLEPKYYEEVLGSICLKKAKRGDRVTFKHFKKV